jgi:hypothetical protein
MIPRALPFIIEAGIALLSGSWLRNRRWIAQSSASTISSPTPPVSNRATPANRSEPKSP